MTTLMLQNKSCVQAKNIFMLKKIIYIYIFKHNSFCFVQAFVTDEQCQRVEINSLHDEENQSMVAVDITTENTSTAVPEQLNPISSWPNLTIPRHGNTPSELQKAQNQIKEAFNTTKNVITKRTSDKEDDDEYDLFGKMLAKKIRKLPEHEREIFMYEIQGLYLSKLHNVNSSAHSDTSSTEIHQ